MEIRKSFPKCMLNFERHSVTLRISDHRQHQAAFTLIEILVALFIFAILGTLTAIGLRTVIHSSEQLKKTHQTLSKIQIATKRMQLDFTQLMPRPILDASGEELPALLIQSAHALEFTTGGYSNPMALEKRGTLRRVAYDWRDGELIRYTWPVLDRAIQQSPEKQVLLKHVTRLSFTYVNSKGQLMNVWQTTSLQGGSIFPRAIVVTMVISHYGEWQGIFPIAGYGDDDEF